MDILEPITNHNHILIMRLSLDALSVIDAIARKGTFAAAAEELHRVPSAITYTVQKLEQDLNLVLFDRSGHRAKLTTTGEELLREGRKLLLAAHNLESRVKQIATGTEPEITIAVSDAFPLERLFPLIAEFYAQGFGTRLRLRQEVLGGTWDALVSERAHLAIGVPGEGPANESFVIQAMGTMRFVFVVAPDHPLAQYPDPIPNDELLQYRAIAAADSSRDLPPRTENLLSDQDVLTLPDLALKRVAHIAGLGVGSIPFYLAEDDLKSGRLVEKQVDGVGSSPPLYMAWDKNRVGNASQWLIDKLTEQAIFADLLQAMA
ncbi:MAG: LysR substrate-binding domain-containing protein [Gammaproteobacteria bacterium]|nr:LysR substrate-binding domain-containing protein [Gammaproteobacteria bacterium]